MVKAAPARNRVSVSLSLSPSLRRLLEQAREKSGRSLSAEVEARLRAALDHRKGIDELLLLKIDSGLLAWIQAFVDGVGLAGGLQDTAIFLLRNALHDLMNTDTFYAAMVSHLASPWREANMESPKWQRLAKEASGYAGQTRHAREGRR